MQKPNHAPPIQYLASFEASARLSSFKAASKELCVTPSAVSQQIKSLERLLGLRLFVRKTREIELTHAGKSFYQVATRTLSTYADGFTLFEEQHYSPMLKVSMFSYIANEVVIPRLHEFQQSHPEIDMNIETTMRVRSLQNSDLDCAIRFGIPPWETNQHHLISKVCCNLLASKKYLSENPVDHFPNLEGHTLIHLRTNSNDWKNLIDTYKFTPKKELFFNSYTAGIKAAEQDLGIAIGLFPGSDTSLQDRGLVPLSPINLPLEEAYYFVRKPNTAKQDSYEALYTWLVAIFNDLS